MTAMTSNGTRKVRITSETQRLWEEQGYGPTEAIAAAVERVNRGAVLLDEQDFDWEQRVRPDSLRMHDGNFCIIGQSYGLYYDKVGPVFTAGALNGFTLNEQGQPCGDESQERVEMLGVEHGFLEGGATSFEEDKSGEEPYVSFGLLDRVWVYLLTERAQQGERVLLRL